MPGVPFVYYGDEIGMDYIEGLPSKEGGYIRTGSRTPMQWNKQVNVTYLPMDHSENAPTVEQQQADENSLLQLVKKLTEFQEIKSIQLNINKKDTNVIFFFFFSQI